MKIGLYLPNWIGDAVMCTPAIRHIKSCMPQAELVGIGLPAVLSTLEENPHLDRTITRDFKGDNREHKGTVLLNRLKESQLDAIVLFTNSFRTAWQAYFTGAKKRIGFDRDYRKLLLTNAVPCPQKKTPHPVIDDYLKLAEAFCGLYEKSIERNRRMELFVNEAEEQQFLDDFRDQFSAYPEDRPYVVLNSSGAFGGAKHWPIKHFAKLAQKIVDQFGHNVFVLCGPSEKKIAEQIVHSARRDEVQAPTIKSPSIGLSKAIIKHARLLTTTDSGPRHFGAAFGVPVVTLFGPTHIAWSETFAENQVHLQHKVSCGPCQKRECPLKHHDCMEHLSVDMVFSAVTNLLHRTADKKAA